MYRMIFRMVLVFAFGQYGKTYASQRTLQGLQRGLLLPGGQYEEFYCNCWFYTPQCANVCKNYGTRYGNAMESMQRPTQMKAPVFNPNTTRYQALGATLDGYTADTVHQGNIYPDYFPVQHLSIETIISSEHLGKRTSSAQGPKNVANKSIRPVGVYTDQAQARSVFPGLSRSQSKRNRNTNVESDRRMCDFLVWIHQAGTSSTDPRQRALLKGILNHFFMSNNLTEIVCESRSSLAKNVKDAYNGIYTLTKGSYVDVFSERTGVLVASSSSLGASAGSGASRVLYSKMYYTTTITPITTIFAPLDEPSSKKSVWKPKVDGHESYTSTMSKADIKQDALIVAGKVHERRSKIENILSSSARMRGTFAEGMSSQVNLRPKYRTTFVWKTITPYITREVIKYPQTAYYTTTELFTITPLTTVFVDDANSNSGYGGNEPYVGPDSVGSYDATPANDYIMSDDTNPYEREALTTQEELPHVRKYRDRNIDLNNQRESMDKAATDQQKRQSNTSAAAESQKSGKSPWSSVVVHSRAVPVTVPARELQLQRNDTIGKDASLSPSVPIISIVESASSLKNAKSLYANSSSMQKTSTVESVQSETSQSSLFKPHYLSQSASREVKSTADEGTSHDITVDTSTTTLVITTTMILDLERILEGPARSIVQRENMLYKGEGQNGKNVHEDSAYASKVAEMDDNDSIDGKKKEDTETKRTGSKEQAAISVGHTTHGASEELTHPDIARPTTGAQDHMKLNKNTAVYTSGSLISGTSHSAENRTSTVAITGKNSLDGKIDAEPDTQRNNVRKKTVTKIFTILTEGEDHSSGTKVITSYIVAKNNNGETAYMHSSKNVPNLAKESTSQERVHISQHTNLMDIPLVSAIVHEINAANLSKTINVATTTKTHCAEDKLPSILERRPGVDMNKKTQEQHFHNGCGVSIVTKNAQAVHSVAGKNITGALSTIKDVISDTSVFTRNTVKSTPPEQTSIVDAMQKSDAQTSVGSNSSVILKSKSRGDDNDSCSFSSKTHYLNGTVASNTVSTFPIVKKVAIDDNFGVEIKVEPA